MRRREISHAFWTDGKVFALSEGAKLLFIGLWQLADREGRLEDKPSDIGCQIRQWDVAGTSKLLAEIAAQGLIQRYDVGGVGFIQVANFLKHQRPHPKEAVSTLPGLSLGEPRSTLGEPRNNLDATKACTLPSEPSEPSEPSGIRAEALALRDVWNEHRGALPKWEKTNVARERQALARLKEIPLVEWPGIVQRMARSRFLTGGNDRGWKATPEFLLRPATAISVLEGKYDNRNGEAATQTQGEVYS